MKFSFPGFFGLFDEATVVSCVSHQQSEQSDAMPPTHGQAQLGRHTSMDMDGMVQMTHEVCGVNVFNGVESGTCDGIGYSISRSNLAKPTVR